jgi:N utilization substance protein B
MKTSLDPRHKKRQRLIQDLFSIEFHKQPISHDVQEILKQKDMLDKKIQEAAPDFPIVKINKIDLAILRLAVYELLIVKKEPANVIIDESVELAKEFGNDTSPSFINGVLGHILKYAKST